MKLKYNFVTNKVADRIVAVAVGDDAQKFNGFIKMNDTGAFIFNMLRNDVTADEIADAMKREYEGVSEDELRLTVRRFIDNLRESDVLE